MIFYVNIESVSIILMHVSQIFMIVVSQRQLIEAAEPVMKLDDSNYDNGHDYVYRFE